MKVKKKKSNLILNNPRLHIYLILFGNLIFLHHYHGVHHFDLFLQVTVAIHGVFTLILHRGITQHLLLWTQLSRPLLVWHLQVVLVRNRALSKHRLVACLARRVLRRQHCGSIRMIVVHNVACWIVGF